MSLENPKQKMQKPGPENDNDADPKSPPACNVVYLKGQSTPGILAVDLKSAQLGVNVLLPKQLSGSSILYHMRKLASIRNMPVIDEFSPFAQILFHNSLEPRTIIFWVIAGHSLPSLFETDDDIKNLSKSQRARLSFVLLNHARPFVTMARFPDIDQIKARSDTAQQITQVADKIRLQLASLPFGIATHVCGRSSSPRADSHEALQKVMEANDEDLQLFVVKFYLAVLLEVYFTRREDDSRKRGQNDVFDQLLSCGNAMVVACAGKNTGKLAGKDKKLGSGESISTTSSHRSLTSSDLFSGLQINVKRNALQHVKSRKEVMAYRGWNVVGDALAGLRHVILNINSVPRPMPVTDKGHALAAQWKDFDPGFLL